jgi:hypothetical protein
MKNPMKKRRDMNLLPLAGQYKYNPDTLRVYLVASEATESPYLERQADLLQWGEEKAKLERWSGDAKDKD